MASAGIGAAAPISPQAKRAAQLARGRATAARNRAAKAEEAARALEEAAGDLLDPMDQEAVEEAPARPAPARAGLGISAARAAQAKRPGAIVGHTPQGRVIVIGRDGKPISRLGERNIDKYAIPKGEIPDGWTYQWIAETVLNEPQQAAIMDFEMKQWTRVPQERHKNHPVRQGGLILVERPSALTEEARREEMQEAKDQIRANVEQFEPPKGLQRTGGIRRGRPVSVSEDGVPDATIELAGDE